MRLFLVFPFHPTCAVDMAANDIAVVTFNGSLDLNFQLSYGITNVDFSAPSVSSVVRSVSRGVADLTLPSGKVDMGASFSVDYTHSDDFSAIVEKLDGSNAFLYVMRAHRDKLAETAGLKADVTITGMPVIKVDPQHLQDAVNGITGGLGGAAVANRASDLSKTLNGKISDWITKQMKGGALLGAEWDQQKSTTMLYKYKIALGNSQNSRLKLVKTMCRGYSFSDNDWGAHATARLGYSTRDRSFIRVVFAPV